MKRFTALVLTVAFALLTAQVDNSQSRPRRGNPQSTGNPQPQPQTSPQQSDDSTIVRPGQPPVLGGANRNPNEQKPVTPQKDAGPEEVGEGDVVRVETTLISIPVSVMDRDGKYIPDLTKDNF